MTMASSVLCVRWTKCSTLVNNCLHIAIKKRDMMKSTCYIIGAGEYFDSPSPKKNDLVICADGGYTSAISHGVRCDLLIGDLDSLEEAPVDVELLRHPVEKNDTDTRLAYLEGLARGYRNFAIYGGTGGLLDHTLANLSLLCEIAEGGCGAMLYGDGYVIESLHNGSCIFSGAPPRRVSIFAFGGAAFGVSIKGLKYEADNITLSPSYALGVSNSFVGKEVQISVKDGTLLIFREV